MRTAARVIVIRFRAILILLATLALELSSSVRVAGAEAPVPDANGRLEVRLPRWPKRGRLDLPWNGQSIASATLSTAPKQYVFSWELRQRGKQLRLDLRSTGEPPEETTLVLETFAPGKVFPDGRRQFALSDAHRISLDGATAGYSWELTPTRPGTYIVEAISGSDRYSGEVAEVTFDRDMASGLTTFTERRDRLVQTSLGRLRIPDTQSRQLHLRLGEGERLAANVIGITLRPTSEGGQLLGQGPDGAVVLPTREATLNGVQARFDDHLGVVVDWSRPSDTLQWEFQIKRPGRFQVMVEAGESGLPTELVLQAGSQRLTIPRMAPNAGAQVVGELSWTLGGDRTIRLQLAGTPTLPATSPRTLRLVPIPGRLAQP